jgi:phage baseplate assembly protein gpV
MSQEINPPVLSSHVASDSATEVARINYLLTAALSGLRTSMPVKVLSVTNEGDVSPIGYVDVQPLVSAVDGSGTPWEHGTIYNVPYMRLQAGSNGIIMDPAVGDIGIASVCDRDISTVKNTGEISAPGSNRKNDMSDMIYLMSVIGAAPTQYVQFNGNGITVHSPTKVIIDAPEVDVNASTTCTINSPSIVLNGAVTQGHGSNAGNASFGGTMTVTGDVTANGTSVHTHKHGGVQPGSGQTGTPV